MPLPSLVTSGRVVGLLVEVVDVTGEVVVVVAVVVMAIVDVKISSLLWSVDVDGRVRLSVKGSVTSSQPGVVKSMPSSSLAGIVKAESSTGTEVLVIKESSIMCVGLLVGVYSSQVVVVTRRDRTVLFSDMPSLAEMTRGALGSAGRLLRRVKGLLGVVPCLLGSAVLVKVVDF